MLIRLAVVVLLVGCAPPPFAEDGTLAVVVAAGPVCPIEQDPPDPECEPRPVAGARILVQPGDGRDMLVGEVTTDEDGHASLELPPGDYLVAALEVNGLMGSPELASVTVVEGETVTLTLLYDTGIR